MYVITWKHTYRASLKQQCLATFLTQILDLLENEWGILTPVSTSKVQGRLSKLYNIAGLSEKHLKISFHCLGYVFYARWFIWALDEASTVFTSCRMLAQGMQHVHTNDPTNRHMQTDIQQPSSYHSYPWIMYIISYKSYSRCVKQIRARLSDKPKLSFQHAPTRAKRTLTSVDDLSMSSPQMSCMFLISSKCPCLPCSRKHAAWTSRLWKNVMGYEDSHDEDNSVSRCQIYAETCNRGAIASVQKQATCREKHLVGRAPCASHTHTHTHTHCTRTVFLQIYSLCHYAVVSLHHTHEDCWLTPWIQSRRLWRGMTCRPGRTRTASGFVYVCV
jgi:hypothetical protein